MHRIIDSKKILKYYIQCDKAAFNYISPCWKKKILFWLKEFFKIGQSGLGLHVLKSNRILEYRFHRKEKSLIHKIIYIFSLLRFKRLEKKYGFELPINVIGPGAMLWHFGQGTIIINPHCYIGKGFSVSANCIVGHAKQKTPYIGDYVDMSVASIIIGGIHVADNTVIGAGAVVTHDVEKENCVIAGVPAHYISSSVFSERISRRKRIESVPVPYEYMTVTSR